MNKIYFTCGNLSEVKKVQRELFKYGCSWKSSGKILLKFGKPDLPIDIYVDKDKILTWNVHRFGQIKKMDVDSLKIELVALLLS